MTLDETLKSIPKGLYQNKKTGNVYEVIDIGEHSEDASLFVIYRRYPNISKRIWCLPVETWYEKFDRLHIIKASELTESGDENCTAIITNKAKCNICGDIIESRHRHDFKTCSCGNVSVDGGLDYLRRCYKKDQDSYTELSEYGIKEGA
ncbi:MAG: DUF1653 domain-containing protein [Synergistaceae bacterium]|nr:DUF1653 domain-containing protein [Synergistaceae bacterium]